MARSRNYSWVRGSWSTPWFQIYKGFWRNNRTGETVRYSRTYRNWGLYSASGRFIRSGSFNSLTK